VLREGVSLRGPTARLLYDAFALASIESQSQSSSGSGSASASCSPSPSSCCSLASWSYCSSTLSVAGAQRSGSCSARRDTEMEMPSIVLSFDARTGRYAVCLEDGKELSLKAECVAKALCAAAGCASHKGGEQDVLSMPGGAVLLTRVPAHGLEGAQSGVQGGTAISIGESEAAMSLRLEEAWSVAAWQVKVYHSAVARGQGGVCSSWSTRVRCSTCRCFG
jgi:hypothetical protein